MAGFKGTTYAGNLLALFFNATTITGVAQNAGSPITNVFVELHTASPGAGGNQQSNEAAYGGYGRQAIARTSVGWTVTGASVSPAVNIVFTIASSGSETETYASCGTLTSGTGLLCYAGPISPSIAVSTGITPTLTTSSVIQEA